MIIKSGFSVYPMEVEKYLLAHPKIRETAIIGLPDARTGEDIHAAVVLKEGASADAAEIIAYSQERMANYKCPKSVHFMEALPKGPNGRVLRNAVKESIAGKINK